MTLAESITRYFYQWEQRGRGWLYCDECVALEPPFAYYDPPYQDLEPEMDDGVRPMPGVLLLNKLANLFSPKEESQQVKEALPMTTRKFMDAPLSFLRISLPNRLDLDGYESRQLLLMLSYCQYPVSFEVIGTSGRMAIQIVCREPDTAHVLGQLKTFYPTCTILLSADALDSSSLYQDTLVAEFGMGQEFMMPLAFSDSKEPSLYLGMKGIFDNLQSGESACVQVLFQGTQYPWAASIMQSVTDGEGGSFFANAPDMPKLAASKTSSQLFGVVVRVMATSPAGRRTDEFIRQVGNALVSQTRSPHNCLIPLSNEGYDPDLHCEDFLSRRSRRHGILLNTEELARIVHVPDEPIITEAVSSGSAKTKPAPQEAQGQAHVLGTNGHMGKERVVTASPTQRFTHTHVIGATGTGKSTFLLNNIVQDIYNGNGLAVLDPHGDLIEAALDCIPESRLSDVIIIDPSDAQYSVGFNILSAANEMEKEVLSSDLVSLFQKFSTSWGDQMTSVLANALIAFLESTEGGTLLDLRRFLIEPSYRTKVLGTVSEPSILYYWNKEYPIIKSNSIGSILTRLDSFLRPKAIRHMLAQRKGLDFADIMNSRRILLVKLSQGLIGESNSYLLGSLLVSKIYQTALGRQAMDRDSRTGFFLYIDEFQNFVTPSLSRILSGGRKYNLSLIVAHQSLEQVSKSDSELTSALISNAGIRVCFRLGETDAQKLEKGFKTFSEEDLLNLPTGEAICRIGRSDIDFNLSVPDHIPFPDSTFVPRDEVITASNSSHGVLRSDLDMAIGKDIGADSYKRSEESVEEKQTSQAVEKILPIKQQKIESIQQESSETKVIDDPELARTIIRRKEESKHKYLQVLIKRNAESRGYKATLEQPTKDGKGRIDVVLQKDKLVYAIEIGVTTSKEWEVHNIEKCLADGFVNVIALSEDMRGADFMTKKLSEAGILPKNESMVKVYDLTGFMGMLNTKVATEKFKVKTIKGYRVKVEYKDGELERKM